MSHFTVAVITKDGEVETALAPYDENTRVAPRIDLEAKKVLAEFKKCQAEGRAVRKKKFKDAKGEPERFWTEEKVKKILAYKTVNEYEVDWCGGELDADGNRLTTYNENSKWDWYDDTGGRWRDAGTIPENHCMVSEYLKLVKTKKGFEKHGTFAIISHLGQWYEKGRMGWWAMVSDKKDENEVHANFIKILEAAPQNWIVTLCDCHI